MALVKPVRCQWPYILLFEIDYGEKEGKALQASLIFVSKLVALQYLNLWANSASVLTMRGFTS
jgi:hypothetical protein